MQDHSYITERRSDQPQPIGEILAELLARYQQRFPGVQIAVVETPATTGSAC